MNPSEIVRQEEADPLAEDRRVADAATPGPWRGEKDPVGHWRILWPASVRSSIARDNKLFADEDVAFILRARARFPDVVRELVAVRAENARLKEALGRLAEHFPGLVRRIATDALGGDR